VFRDEHPAAFIDWDLAAPGPRMWDVAYALWHFTPLYGDPSSDPYPIDTFEPRARRVALFCDAYGLDDRTGLVEAIVAVQQTAHDAIKNGAEDGNPAYQRLWELGACDGIRRQIAFVQAHRAELERAVT
jgi:aminoglycoside phosphotransferase (APT) family kinase protein